MTTLLHDDEGPTAEQIHQSAPDSRHATVPWICQLAKRVRAGEISIERAMLALKWQAERNGREESREAFAPLDNLDQYRKPPERLQSSPLQYMRLTWFGRNGNAKR